MTGWVTGLSRFSWYGYCYGIVEIPLGMIGVGSDVRCMEVPPRYPEEDTAIYVVIQLIAGGRV